MKKLIFILTQSVFILFLSFYSLHAASELKADFLPEGVPVLLNGKMIFKIYSAPVPYTVQQRAASLSERLSEIRKTDGFVPEKIDIHESGLSRHIRYEERVIMSVTAGDMSEGEELDSAARRYHQLIRDGLSEKVSYTVIDEPEDIYRFFLKRKDLIVKAGLSFLAFIVLILSLVVIGKLFSRLYLRLSKSSSVLLRGIKFKNYEIMGRSTVISLLGLILKGLRLFVYVMGLYLYINFLFSVFPWADYSLAKDIFTGSLLTVLTVAIWFGIYRTVRLFFSFMKDSIQTWKGSIIKPFVVRNITLMTDDQIVNFIKKSALLMQFVTNLFLLYIFIPIVFSYFEFTKTWADTLFGYILSPLKTMMSSFLAYLPSLFFIAVVILVNRYLIKLSAAVFRQIKFGAINIPGFHSDWADPTHKIVRFLIIIFTVIVIYPYLPGSSSEAFRGISIFLGILFSLGSTSIIANVVAGIILTYMYAFRIGDRVQIGDTTGDVVEKTLLVTRVRTVKNVIVTIPNSTIMSSQIINYSSSLSDEKLILHTQITLGYDVPWRKVHEVLVSAALATENIADEPEPFVLQTGLDDYYVRYELNAYTDRPHLMAKIYSRLHQNIQDLCNEAGIEILSPRYEALRDGNRTTIPSDYLDKEYEPEGFLFRSKPGNRNGNDDNS